jgi:ketosteroid isomerase-like protein
MKVLVRAAATTALLVFCVAPLHGQARLVSDTALASLARADRAFARLSADSMPQRAFLRFMAGNALIYRPRAVKAHEYLRSRPMHPAIALLWEPTFADVAAAGDLGYTTGPWISSRRDAPQADPIFGQYVNIWRRQPDRSWKVEVHAAIAHDADAVGPGQLRVPPAPAAQARGPVDRDAAIRSLLQADAALAGVSQDLGAAAAFRDRAAPELRVLQQGEFAATGNAAHGLLRTIAVYRWQPAAASVSAAADLGYTYGQFITATGPASHSVNRRGDYLRIWKRSAAGEWQVVLDLAAPM